MSDADNITLTKTLANRIRTDWRWLYSLIQFESAWDSQAWNRTSGARGLIQFMPTTAREMGYADANDLVRKHPTAASQMTGPVANYFKKRGSSFPTEQSLYMAVFYPRFKDVPPDTVFSDKVQAQNPGIRTVQDYINKVRSRLPQWMRNLAPDSPMAASIDLFLLIGLGVLAYIFFLRKK